MEDRIKGASCSGEGGEDAKRFKILPNGIVLIESQAIASARFGVTVDYLNNANEIEIKIAQGANQVRVDNYLDLKLQRNS